MSEELSREALIIYLNDLRTMEMIIHESDKRVVQLNEKNEEKKCELEDKKDIYFEKPTAPVKTPILDVLRENSGWVVADLIAVFGIIGYFVTRGFHSVLFVYIAAAAFFTYKVIAAIRKSNNNYKADIELYKRFCDEQEQAKEIHRENCENWDEEFNAYSEKINASVAEIEKEKSNIQKQLESAYNINIIPLHYRDIMGVTYLYDYMSTSNQTLESALMQYNLEAIKSKLDNVIQLQAQSIIEQAKANAALYEQNQKILATAQSTMQNTAVAAKYAQISAINSTLSLELQNEQLAYQKAEFWLG